MTQPKTPFDELVALNIKIEPALLAKLRDEYAQSYPQHRQAWRTWLSERLEARSAAQEAEA